jgi:hypothetical protein
MVSGTQHCEDDSHGGTESLCNATVRQESCQTLAPKLPAPASATATAAEADPAKMNVDELADYVVNGIKKFEHYLPLVRVLKGKAGLIPRDSKNRFKVPLKGCYSWGEFCRKYLDRTRQAVDQAIDEPEFSNRELQRRAYRAEHPEEANKSNREIDKAIQREHHNSKKGTMLPEQLLTPSSEELRPEWKERIFYGEADEEYAIWAQKQQDKGIGVVGAGARSHGHGLKRLRTKSNAIPVRHSIKAKGSGSFSLILTLSGLLEREVIPLLRFQEEQRKNGVPKVVNLSQSPKPVTDPEPPTESLPEQVHVDEVPLATREEVLLRIEKMEQAEGVHP